MDGRNRQYRAERSRRLFNEMDEDNDGLLVRGSGSGGGSGSGSGSGSTGIITHSELRGQQQRLPLLLSVWFCRLVSCLLTTVRASVCSSVPGRTLRR
eukprot:COSAG06_NODE_1609_length_8943_cov_90.568182_8_plen_97_part_00